MRQFLVGLVALVALTNGTVAQNTQGDFGGSYDSLKPEQKALVNHG